MTERITTKHNIQIDDENITRPGYSVVQQILITGSMYMSYTGIDPGTGVVTVYISGSGVTNGNAHDHNGGDGGTISYPTLSNKPVAETQTDNIFGAGSAGASSFSSTIVSLPGGAPTTLVYNSGSSGNDNALVPIATTQLGKMILYNTTRGTSALISNSVVVTRTITFTANVPAGWQVGDTITIASQTVSGGGVSWVDIKINSGPTGKTYMFLDLLYKDTTVAGNVLQFHSLETYAVSKSKSAPAYVANQTTVQLSVLVKIVNDTFSLSWQASGSNTASAVVRESGYLE